jgi:hypothetical protein
MEYADPYAPGDLSDCFNFNQAPLKFVKIHAFEKNYFLHNKASVTPPDND